MTILHQGHAWCALRQLRELGAIGPGTFIYCDPPYPAFTRLQQSRIYKNEMMLIEEHVELLYLLDELSRETECKIMISCYDNWLYRERLDWRSKRFQAYDRGGNLREEVVWMSYEEPNELHDYNFLGSDFRERERIKRKRSRWLRNFQSMTRYERLAFIEEAKALGLI